jgi:hypothetical protein
MSATALNQHPTLAVTQVTKEAHAATLCTLLLVQRIPFTVIPVEDGASKFRYAAEYESLMLRSLATLHPEAGREAPYSRAAIAAGLRERHGEAWDGSTEQVEQIHHLLSE